MYHATKNPDNVASILDSGFKISQGQDGCLALGDGLYVSRDIEKTLSYGSVCFKLLVYPGKTLRVSEKCDPLRQAWQGEHSSAWVPPGCDWVRHRREETCVKSSAQVCVLGIAYGHELLDAATKTRVRDLFGSGDTLDRQENRVLEQMLERLGIVYSCLVHEGSSLFLESVSGRRGEVGVADWSGGVEQLWSRTWDNCLENKATGEVLCGGGEEVSLGEVEAAGSRSQKWRLDKRGRLVHKASEMLLKLHREGRVGLASYGAADREVWRFRCMDYSTRATDSFVQYTPWQDMISWD